MNKCADARRVGDWRSALREVDAAIASGADASPEVCVSQLLVYHRNLYER